MTVRAFAEYVLPPVAVDAGRRLLHRRRHAISTVDRYIENGRVPWSPGYSEFRMAWVRTLLDDPAVLATFATGGALPSRFGIGIDERCIEYPWVVSRMGAEPGRHLDAGSTFNYRCIVDHPTVARKSLHILTLSPEPECFWDHGISYVFDDLRGLPMRDDLYDSISAISTLEHVGLDNSYIAGRSEYRESSADDFCLAVRELRRVLKPGGVLLFTVPYGQYTDLGIQQQFDEYMLRRAIDAFGPAAQCEVMYYRYGADGWRTAVAQECASARYVAWISDAWRTGRWPAPVPREPDMAAAARAVACVKLLKP